MLDMFILDLLLLRSILGGGGGGGGKIQRHRQEGGPPEKFWGASPPPLGFEEKIKGGLAKGKWERVRMTKTIQFKVKWKINSEMCIISILGVNIQKYEKFLPLLRL